MLQDFAQERFFDFTHDQSMQLCSRMALNLAQVAFNGAARKLAQILSDLRWFGHRLGTAGPVMITVKSAAVATLRGPQE